MIILFIGLILALCSTMLAVALQRHPQWYLRRNQTWKAVVIGCLLVYTAQVALYYVNELNPLTMFLMLAVGGGPQIAWQLLLASINSQELELEKHESNHARRAGCAHAHRG